MIHICTLKYGTKYSFENVNNLYNSIKKDCKEFKFHCLTDDETNLDPNINIIKIKDDLSFYGYFNKLRFYDNKFINAKDGDEIIILDIDQSFIGNSSKIVECEVKELEHLFEYRWSSQRRNICPINSGVQKFICDKSRKYILNEFMENSDKWLLYDFKAILNGDQFGDQTFTYDRLKNTHTIKFFPKQSIVRLRNNHRSMANIKKRYFEEFSEDLFFGTKLNPATVLIHYSGDTNDVFDANFFK
jgi:hypothetical protein